MGTLDIGGSAGNSFPFERHGDTVTGTIVDMREEQSIDMNTGAPATWPDGNPKMHYRITLQTDLRDPVKPDDDGQRDIFVRGSRKPETKSSLSAVLQAVKQATGGADLATGATLSMTYVSDGEPSARGMNPPKQYSATYTPPTVSLEAPAQQPTAAAPPAYQPPTAITQPPSWAQPEPATRPTPTVQQNDQLAALAALGITPEQLAALQQTVSS